LTPADPDSIVLDGKVYAAQPDAARNWVALPVPCRCPQRLTPKKLGWTRGRWCARFLIFSEEVRCEMDAGR